MTTPTINPATAPDDDEQRVPPLTIGRYPARLFDAFDELTKLYRFERQFEAAKDYCEISKETQMRREAMESFCLTLKPDWDEVADMLLLINTRLDLIQSEVDMSPRNDAELTLVKRAVASCFHAIRDSVKGNGGILNEFYGLPETWEMAAQKALDLKLRDQNAEAAGGAP